MGTKSAWRMATAILTTRKTARGPEARQRTGKPRARPWSEHRLIRSAPPALVFGLMRSPDILQPLGCVSLNAPGWSRLTSHEAGRHGIARACRALYNVDVVTAAELGGWQSPRHAASTSNPTPKEGRALIMDIFAGKKAKGLISGLVGLS